VKQRFEREARAISSLQHPNICTLYDVGHQDGTDFLVMEYLEGETLADRLAKGPLASEQVLKIGVEICEGLEKAHRTGVVHRDLKPGNIMLTKTGAKLLDFGLAKPLEVAPAVSLTASPTSSRAMEAAAKPVTAEGTIVGTFQYMAPEQLEGKEADERSDIFALGAVLYEMATERRAFEGKSQTSVIAAILEREPPPISSLQPMSPPQLDRVVKLCLAKDPDARIQSAHDVKLQLEWIRDAGSQAGVPAPVVAHRKNRERVAWAAMALMTIVAALSIVENVLRVPKLTQAVFAEFEPPPTTTFAFGENSGGTPTLSPDGQRLAFVAVGSDGHRRLWVRALNSAAAQPLEGTDGANYPFWSPDGRSIGFFSNGKLNRIDLSGGSLLALADAPDARGGSWGADGTILFAPSGNGPLFRVPASGGPTQQVTQLSPSRKDFGHRFPQFLPDGKHFLFYVLSAVAANSGVYTGSLDGGEPKLVFQNDSSALYVPPHYLLFVRQGTLMSTRFDAASLRLSGELTAVTEHVALASNFQGLFTTSGNGILAYARGTGALAPMHLLWFDRSGKQIGETGTPSFFYDTPSIAPDGGRLAVSTSDAQTPGLIWVFDLRNGTKRRLNFSSAFNAASAWSPDGKTLAFMSNRAGGTHFFQRPADGTGSTTPLFANKELEQVAVSATWTGDGRYLVFKKHAGGASSPCEVWAMPFFGDRQPFRVVSDSRCGGSFPAVSPDGKWLAYVSGSPGQSEVDVAPFPRGNGKWEVSTDGGSAPRWRRDGKELFYLSLEGEIMAAEVAEQGTTLVVEKVQPLFWANPVASPGWNFDSSPDGQKFVVVSRGQQQSPQPLTLVLNWPALLKQR
jgi:eukaryotic-like serine/threonine-protein kinase